MQKTYRDQKHDEALAVRDAVVSEIKAGFTKKCLAVVDVPRDFGDPQIKIDDYLEVTFEVESRSTGIISREATGRVRAIYWGHDYKRINRVVGKDVPKFVESLCEFIADDKRSRKAENDRAVRVNAANEQRDALKEEFPIAKSYRVSLSGTDSSTTLTFNFLTIERARKILEAVSALDIYPTA